MSESPTNGVGNGGYTQSAADSGPVAGIDKRLFKGDDDLLSQDYQTPAEVGLNKYRFSNIYPVLKLTLSNSQGDGPSIDQMVSASKEFVNRMEDGNTQRVKKTFGQFNK